MLPAENAAIAKCTLQRRQHDGSKGVFLRQIPGSVPPVSFEGGTDMATMDIE